MIDLVAELEALLLTWRAHRATPTAALIDELSSWFALVLPPIRGRTHKSRHRSWITRAKLHRAVELPGLLATVAQSTATYTLGQLEMLATWPSDPRMTWLARRLYAAPPFPTSAGDQSVWRQLFHLLEVHEDPRALAVIDTTSMAKVFDATAPGLAMRAHAKAVVAWVERFDVPFTTDDRAAHDARAARLTAELETGRALRDAVRIEEDDEHQPSRLVYLDWLIERGYVP